MKLFLAEGPAGTLLSTRAPFTRVPCDRLTLGAIVVVRPRPGEEAADAFAPPRAPWWRGSRGAAEPVHRWVSAPEDRQPLTTAADAAVLTLHRWPSLRRYVDLDDPGPALATALWELAGTLLDRGRVRATLAELIGTQAELPAGSGLVAEIAERADLARARTARLDTAVAAQVGHLTRLADETEAFVERQEALQRARSVLRDADYLVQSAPAPGVPLPDAADLADRTSAVLAAYRELTAP
ncbi:hypothetical protein [Symbioplanes lichenis]|uniref:hypothetical protein n=1 Tax=Symbioplanes lichenis TaxID=1629072 RepID=UPI0027397C9D|nr:hypothetical protein [Actinoplanes lichenis]